MRDQITKVYVTYRDWLEDIAAGLLSNGVDLDSVRVKERPRELGVLIHGEVYVKGIKRYVFRATMDDFKIAYVCESADFDKEMTASLARFGIGKRLI